MTEVNFIKMLIAIATFISVSSAKQLQISKSRPNNSIASARSFESQTNINKLNILKLGVPPFSQNAPDNVITIPSLVNLILRSSNPNKITDTDAWFERNDLSLPTYRVPNPFRQISSNIPDNIPKSLRNNMLVKAIRHGDKEFLIYGRHFAESRYLLIYDRAEDKFTRGYDFSNYIYSPSYLLEDKNYINQNLNWVVPEDNILYFSHSHNTYAQSSDEMNGYITALDLDTNQILWRSQSLVCNANNFVIIDNVIICGYGFTAEPDYLYLVNKNTGEVLQQIKLKTAPNYIIPKDNKLYVRTYDTDYVFSIQK